MGFAFQQQQNFPLEISATLLRNCMFSAGGTRSETLQEPQSSPLTKTSERKQINFEEKINVVDNK